MPLQIGITGGIGSGKSLVCRIFQTLSAPVYDADSRAKWLMQHHPDVRNGIISAFGAAAYSPNGQLDRKYLASRVFTDGNQVSALNQLVHPHVGEDYANWVITHSHAPYVLKEAALLFEAGSYQTLDKIIVVHAPADLRIRRVRQRDPHRSEAEIRAIIAKQLPDEEKLRRADYVVYNDETQLVIPQVLKLHEEFNTNI